MAAWRFLPGGPVGPVSRWATTSNVKYPVGQTTYPVNRGTVGARGEKGARNNITKTRTEKEGVELGKGTRGP